MKRNDRIVTIAAATALAMQCAGQVTEIEIGGSVCTLSKAHWNR